MHIDAPRLLLTLLLLHTSFQRLEATAEWKSWRLGASLSSTKTRALE